MQRRFPRLAQAVWTVPAGAGQAADRKVELATQVGSAIQHPAGSGPSPFAHPSEKDFADLLTFYGICWQYEAVCFPLMRAAEGTVLESFTPDFYLPEYRVFVEVTTARQRLVTRKNRKIRLFRELYPELRLVIIYRKNFQSLLLKLGLS